jgi:hypothetical protein
MGLCATEPAYSLFCYGDRYTVLRAGGKTTVIQTVFHTPDRSKVTVHLVFHVMGMAVGVIAAGYEAFHLAHGFTHEVSQTDQLTVTVGTVSALHTILGTGYEVIKDFVQHRF